MAQQVGYPAFITAGLPGPNGKVPVLNGVPGSGIANLAVGIPTTVLNHGQVYLYTLASQNNTYNGVCTDSHTLTQVQAGVTVNLDSKVIKTYNCGPGSQWVWIAGGAAIPNSPGPARLTGLVKFGTTVIATKLNVVIQ